MSYRDRRLARADRLREWAEKRRSKSASAFKTADQAVAGIPFGQPILVGHHSERRHRAALDRHDTNMRKAFEHADMAGSMASKAAEIERQADHAIYSDDVDAIERLTEKIAGLEAERAAMKVRNTEYRKAHKAELQALPSAYARSQAMPHAGYEFQNLGGNITRLRKRLAFLSGSTTPAQAQTTDPAGCAPQGATATERAGLRVSPGMTTPSRAGKAPRPVWSVVGNLACWRPMLIRLGGNWYRGAFSFWDDPTAEIEQACAEAEQDQSTTPAAEGEEV